MKYGNSARDYFKYKQEMHSFSLGENVFSGTSDINEYKEFTGRQVFGLEKFLSLKFLTSSRKSLSLIKIENYLESVCLTPRLYYLFSLPYNGSSHQSLLQSRCLMFIQL